jgi:hypothetical protein
MVLLCSDRGSAGQARDGDRLAAGWEWDRPHELGEHTSGALVFRVLAARPDRREEVAARARAGVECSAFAVTEREAALLRVEDDFAAVSFQTSQRGRVAERAGTEHIGDPRAVRIVDLVGRRLGDRDPGRGVLGCLSCFEDADVLVELGDRRVEDGRNGLHLRSGGVVGESLEALLVLGDLAVRWPRIDCKRVSVVMVM